MSRFSRPLVVFGLGVLALAPDRLLAREFSVPIMVETAEELYDLADAEEISADELELLIALLSRPMDLNRADRYTLYDLPGLSWGMVDRIIAHRAAIDGFVVVEQLRDVSGLSEGVFVAIRPFVRVTAEEIGEQASLLNGRARVGTVIEGGLGADLRSPNRPDKYPSGHADLEVRGFTYFGAGLQVILRPLVNPQWDQGINFMVDDGAECPAELNEGCIKPRLNLKSYYATAEWNQWRIVAGTYNVGFGQRLTMDTTKKEYPRGWDHRLSHTLDRDDGAVRPVANLRGVAVQLEGMDTPVGWLDATVFFSHQSQDLYRNDLVYLGDELVGAPISCEADSDCPAGYSCKEYGLCATSTVYDLGQPGKKFQFHTFENPFAEVLAGGNVAFSFGERSHVGATFYRSHVYFNLPREANPRFTPGATYPRRPDFGAASIDGAFGFGDLELAAEIGLTHRGNPAGVGQLVYIPAEWLELFTSFRWYSRDYDNPHSRSRAAATETLGSRRRNQLGGDIALALRPIPELNLYTQVELYARPYREAFAERRILWVEDPIFYLRLRERVAYELTRLEQLGFQFDYANNDLNENGRGSVCQNREVSPGVPEETCGSYASSGLDDSAFEDAFETAVATRFPGRGEKLAFRFSIASSRLFNIRMSLQWVFAALDIKGQNDFAIEDYIRFAIASRLWEGARVWGTVKYWGAQATGTSEDDLVAYAGLSQSLFDGLLFARAVWGIKGAWRRDAAQSENAGSDVYDLDLRHFLAFQIESRF